MPHNCSEDSDLLIERVERVFRNTFRNKLEFALDLERANVAAWTSLKHIELLIGLERQFHVRFDGADAVEMLSIPLVLSRLSQKLL
jgi:acyl carrier protein